MAISSLSFYQDNKVGDSNLMPIHSPLVFLVDVVYDTEDPYYIYCKVYNESDQLLDTFKCLPYKDITVTQRRFMFIADSILRGYMESFEDFAQTNGTIIEVEKITKKFKLVFSDPDKNATDIELEIEAIHATSQYGEYPNKSNIYNNDNENVIGVYGKPCYLYVYSYEDAEITIGVSYMVKFIISDSEGFVSGATITINGLEKTTDTNGEALYYLNNGSYNYSIEKTGYITKTGTINIDGSGIIANVTLLEDTLYTVEFTVTHEGSPIENAAIIVQGNSPIYTNSLGVASIDLYSNTYSFEVDAGIDYFIYEDTFTLNYAPLSVPVSLTESTGYSCLFHAIEGTPPQVSDVENVLINIDSISKSGTTDVNGELTLTDILPGTYSFTAAKSGYYITEGTITITNSNITKTVIMNQP